MRSFDLSPLFRSTVGFDHLAGMLDAATRLDEQTFSYPPYNIEKLGEDKYRVTMAVAGFGEGDLEVTSKENSLVVTGRSTKEVKPGEYLHRGIAGRAFERRFELADHVRATEASLVNGLLSIDLVREVPEAMKPRSIAISTKASAEPKSVEAKAA